MCSVLTVTPGGGDESNPGGVLGVGAMEGAMKWSGGECSPGDEIVPTAPSRGGVDISLTELSGLRGEFAPPLSIKSEGDVIPEGSWSAK